MNVSKKSTQCWEWFKRRHAIWIAILWVVSVVSFSVLLHDVFGISARAETGSLIANLGFVSFLIIGFVVFILLAAAWWMFLQKANNWIKHSLLGNWYNRRHLIGKVILWTVSIISLLFLFLASMPYTEYPNGRVATLVAVSLLNIAFIIIVAFWTFSGIIDKRITRSTLGEWFERSHAIWKLIFACVSIIPLIVYGIVLPFVVWPALYIHILDGPIVMLAAAALWFIGLMPYLIWIHFMSRMKEVHIVIKWRGRVYRL